MQVEEVVEDLMVQRVLLEELAEEEEDLHV
jgi:hypothetical protein